MHSDDRPDLQRFARAVEARLARGEREYANTSFRRSPAGLVREILEELEDVAGWAFIAWHRVRGLRGRLERLESEPAALHPPGGAPRGGIHETTPAEGG